jgi:hypothetical protein
LFGGVDKFIVRCIGLYIAIGVLFMSYPENFDFDEATKQLKMERERCRYLTAMAANGDFGWIDHWLSTNNFLDYEGFEILKELVIDREHFNN